MSASASSFVYLGFPVTHDDFWDVAEHQGALACPKGHTAGAAEGKFCRECGGAFGRRTRRTKTPAEGFRRYCEEIGKAPRDLVDPDPDAWGDHELDGLEVFCCDGYGDADTDEQDHALGKLLAGTGDITHGEGGESLAVSDMRVYLARLEHVRDRLGLRDREIRLYLCSSCSY